jgi:hypothetical protein
MCVPLHAYQVSHPHRMRAFEEAMDHHCGHAGVWKATGREIARHYLDTALRRGAGVDGRGGNAEGGA